MLHDADGRPVALGERLGRGGEGEVFAVAGRPGLVAKVLAPAKRGGKASKLEAMLAHVPPGAHGLVEGFPVLTWPQGLLLDGRTVVGYTMTRVQPQAFVPWHQVTSTSRRAGLGGPALTFGKLALLGLRLAHVVATLHRLGYAVGDLNDRNVGVSRRLTPLLMDTDSFQVPDGRRTHPCTVGDALYWPPELLDVDLCRHPVDRRAGDDHALAVLLFQLFLGGLRPYQSRGTLVAGLETLQAKTRAGHYPWARPRPGVLEPPVGAPDYAALPKALRRAFERAFVDGHRKPSRRPSAAEWVEVLRQVRDGPQPRLREPVPVPSREPRPAVRPVGVRRQARVVRGTGVPKGPPQHGIAATHTTRGRAATTSPSRAVARPSRPSPRSSTSVRRGKTAGSPSGRRRAKPMPKERARRRPRRARWPLKARVLAGLTMSLLLAWWGLS